MKAMKKIVVLLLAVLMIATAFTGCANTEPEESKGNSEALSNGSEDTPKEEPVTVKWIIAGDETEYTKEVVDEANKLLLERYNLQLDATMVSFGNYNDKMNMIINGGDDWDLSFSSAGWLNIYSEQVGKGAFLDLSPYIESNPKLTAHIPDYMVEAARMNDGIYAIPNYQISVSSNGMILQKAILDEMKEAGIDFDYTKVKYNDDLIPFLDYVKENHPELYPCDAFIAGQVEDYKGQEKGWVGIQNYIYAVPDGDGYRLINEYLEWTPEEQMENKYGRYYIGMAGREYWEKGYLREDIATVLNDTAEINAGRYAATGNVLKPGIEGEVLRNRGYECVAVQTIKPIFNAESMNAMTAVNANSKHPDAAVKMMEAINTDAEIFNILLFGLEGNHYHLDEEGKVVVDKSTGIQAWVIGNQCNALLTQGQADDTWEATDKMNREAEVSPLCGFSVSNENVVEEVAAVSAVMEEYNNWQYEDDYNERYSELVTKLSGPMTTILADYQAQLDAWLVAKK